ncbi:MAG TPA: hypothetical protein VN861_18475 [Candidatus Acidoferrales bacterium]|nr:hypothetical protein [Candidatus Acidoferrales bacterium]
MKISCRHALTALLLALVSTAASAQMGRFSSPHVSGFWNPVVGEGAQYSIQSQKGDKTDMQITVVGKESVDGKDAYWYEMSFNRGNGEMVMKQLMVLNGADTQISRMIMQMPGRPPMEMPTQMLHQDHAPQTADVRTGGEDLGSDTITVPAGTFTCQHYRTKSGGEVWVSQKVSPYGLVKSKSNDSSMELTKVITGAKDQITGTPQPFSPQMMMQQQQPQQ